MTMTTTINPSTIGTATSPAARLRQAMAAVRVSLKWCGTVRLM